MLLNYVTSGFKTGPDISISWSSGFKFCENNPYLVVHVRLRLRSTRFVSIQSVMQKQTHQLYPCFAYPILRTLCRLITYTFAFFLVHKPYCIRRTFALYKLVLLFGMVWHGTRFISIQNESQKQMY